MKFNAWSIDELIEFLRQMKMAPKGRLSDPSTATVRGEIFIENCVNDEEIVEENG